MGAVSRKFAVLMTLGSLAVNSSLVDGSGFKVIVIVCNSKIVKVVE
jgi:hypothetical protein